jgi:hypothetical protein
MSDISDDWPAIIDDDGSLTTGTPVNLTNVWNPIKAAINNQVKSTDNPLSTPADAIDELVLARGSMGTLALRLAVSLNADGTLIQGTPVQYLNGTLDVGANWLIQSARELRMSGAGVAHGATDFAPTDVYAQFLESAAGAGGLKIRGYTDNDSAALQLVGNIGSTTPTVAPVRVFSVKKSGTSVTNLADTEMVFEVYNNGTTMYTVYGSGKIVFHAAAITGSNVVADFQNDAASVMAIQANGVVVAKGLLVGFTGAPVEDAIYVGTSGVGLDYNAGTPKLSLGSITTRFLENLTGTGFVMQSGGTVSFPIGVYFRDDGSIQPYNGNAGLAGNLRMDEYSSGNAPAAPGAGGVIYFDDNGAGKTRLMVRFPTGASQQVAIEP